MFCSTELRAVRAMMKNDCVAFGVLSGIVIVPDTRCLPLVVLRRNRIRSNGIQFHIPTESQQFADSSFTFSWTRGSRVGRAGPGRN